MRIRIRIELLSNGGKELSQETLEILNIQEAMEAGGKTGIEQIQMQGVNKAMERMVLEAQIAGEGIRCGWCGSRGCKKDGKRERQLKTLNGDIGIRVGKIYCKGCGRYSQMGRKRLPPESNISQELERMVLELVPMTTSYEGLSELLYKLKGIKISAKEIERIVKERGEQIRQLENEEMQKTEREEDLEAKPRERLYIESDGTYVHSVDGKRESMEGKFGIVFGEEMAQVSKARKILMDKRYCSSFYGKEEFGGLLHDTAYRMGMSRTRELVYICDGAKTLWDIKREYFPEAKGILDWCHVQRNLQRSLVVMADDEKRRKKKKELRRLLYTGQSEKAVVVMGRLIQGLEKKKWVSKKRLKLLKDFQGYIENNRVYVINYRKAKAQGYLITSSVMEGTINIIGANRLKKRRSRKWSRVGADGVVRIITCLKNNEWEKTWNQIYAQKYAFN